MGTLVWNVPRSFENEICSLSTISPTFLKLFELLSVATYWVIKRGFIFTAFNKIILNSPSQFGNCLSDSDGAFHDLS